MESRNAMTRARALCLPFPCGAVQAGRQVIADIPEPHRNTRGWNIHNSYSTLTRATHPVRIRLEESQLPLRLVIPVKLPRVFIA